MALAKKGQGGAAILIALIAALIILYVLFLPPQERAALLGESSGSSSGGGTGTAPAAIIYTSPVGKVLPAAQPQVIHDIPAIPIRAIEQGQIVAKRDTIIAENNAFEKKVGSVLFASEPTLTRNAVLSMNLASITDGNLVVTLNGIEIYNKHPSSRTFPPITLQNLQNVNELQFSASSVGFGFWRTNRITLSDVKVTADVTDLSAASVTQHVVIPKDELRDTDSAVLTFSPICTTEGPITIMLNDVSLFEGRPDCENSNSLEIAPSRLKEGENTLGFSTRSADIIFDQGRITTHHKAIANSVFSFQIDPVKVQGHPITMRLYFADGGARSGTVILNGNRLPIGGGATAQFPITTALRPGTNSLSFESAGDPFEIVRFEIVLG